MVKGLGHCDLVQDLETGVRLDYSGGPNINTWILSKGRQGGWRQRFEGATLLALKLEEKAMNHRMQVASGKEGNSFSLEPPERAQSC